MIRMISAMNRPIQERILLMEDGSHFDTPRWGQYAGRSLAIF